jgi:hypothetical protein
MAIAYPRASRPAFLDALELERICAAEFGTFSKRHSRYLIIAAMIYWHSLLRWRKTRVLRVGFCLLQAVDDLLDGDRSSDTEPADIAAGVVRQMQSGSFGDDRLAILARALAEDLSALGTDKDRPLEDAIELIRHMMRDRGRARDRLLLGREELRQHHRATFRHSLNLLLVAVGAKLRAQDIPELIEAFGWCSTMRDLREDLNHGLVNVPDVVIEAARREVATLDDFEQLLQTGAVREWQYAELERAQTLLRSFGARGIDPSDRAGNRVLGLFGRSIGAFARRAERALGD